MLLGDAFTENMRLKMFTILKSAPAGASSVVIGVNNGEVLALDTSPNSKSLFWSLSANLTGYRYSSWPATSATNPSAGLTSDSDWLQRFSEISYGGSHFNATLRVFLCFPSICSLWGFFFFLQGMEVSRWDVKCTRFVLRQLV